MTIRALALVLTIVVQGCGRNKVELSGEITTDGSSTVHPLTAAVTESFVKLHPSVKISGRVSGTSGGFERFCRGEIDVQNASRSIDPEERIACERSGVAFMEIPVAYDALTIVVHPANDWTSPVLSGFVTFYLNQDQALVRSIGGIPMTARAYELVQQRVAKKITGTLFTAEQGHQSLEMLLTSAQ